MLVKLFTANDVEIYETLIPSFDHRPEVILWRKRCFKFTGESLVENKAKYYSYTECEFYLLIP